jgi:hypothetical protein
MGWDELNRHLKSGSGKKKTIYLVVGAPGSGKTWVTNQLKEKFHLIHHDGYIYLKEPGAYVREVLKQAKNYNGKVPLLIEAPFSVRQTVEPIEQAGFKVVPVFITEDAKTHSDRYRARENKEIPKGHLTRTETYKARAEEGGHFHGTSAEVLDHLNNLPPASIEE